MDLFSLFRRKPAAPVDLRVPNDWRVGDLAVCIRDDWPENDGTPDPKKGQLLQVSRVVDDYTTHGLPARCYFLEFVGWRGAWHIAAFRKVVADIDPAEEEFTALIKRPVRKPVGV